MHHHRCYESATIVDELSAAARRRKFAAAASIVGLIAVSAIACTCMTASNDTMHIRTMSDNQAAVVSIHVLPRRSASHVDSISSWKRRRLDNLESPLHASEHRTKNYPTLVGIIGGIGPLADVRLAQLIVELDQERCLSSTNTYHNSNGNLVWEEQKLPGFTVDACHTPYLLYSNPRHIPNNNLANLGLGPPSVDALVDSAEVLAKAGATVIGMACTAAHTWRDEVEQRLNSMTGCGIDDGNEVVQVLDLLELTAQAVANDGHGTVGLVEVDGTIKAGLFVEAMKRHGIEPILPDANHQAQVMEAVSDIKWGEVDREDLKHRLENVVLSLLAKNANITAVVWGCTDIAAIIGEYEGIDDEARGRHIEYYDTLGVLAEEIVRVSNM